MKQCTTSKKINYLLGIILFIGLWQLISLIIDERVMLLPGPFDTLINAIYQLGKPYTLECIGASFIKLLMGYGIALIIGFVLGIISGNSEFVYDLLKPLMTFLRSVPTASLVYLFIVLAGFKMAPLCLVVLISFPIIYDAIAVAIKNVDEKLIEASRLDGADIIKENISVRLPLSFRYFVKPLFSTFSLAFKTEIMAEVLTGSTNKGLGNLISSSRAIDPTNMVPVFAYALIAVVLMMIVECVSTILLHQIDNRL
ncbi:MAG: ABC transporter permease subunit [Erysipelotrichaceae bacterium]|nr:ABC transporter permease subunit [Erysipelotrichaceae bacterium]